MRIYIKVIPRASRNEVVKINDGEYKVKITAPPVGGAANDMLVRVLAEYFRVLKSCIVIKAGKTAKVKLVDIEGI